MQSTHQKVSQKTAKLDHHSSNGNFVGYTATTKNIYYTDNTSNSLKIGLHALFDDAHLTSPQSKTLGKKALQSLGYSVFRHEFKVRHSWINKQCRLD